MKDTLTLFEYDHLCTDDGAEDTIFIDSDAFNALELFLCSQAANENINAEETHEVFRFSSRRGRKTLAAQNYVGVISAGNTEIEILPKIGKKIRYCDSEYERVRRTFLAMLQELRDAPFKNLGCAELTTARMPLFEIFISAFLNEVSKVVRSGLRSDYQDWSGNERFLRGRLNFSEQLRLNHANSSRFAVEYSVYHVNRPENRLIKTALQFAARRSQNPLNRRRIKIASDHLSDVEPSTNPRADFAACKSDRNMTHYASALAWCRIFLASEAPVPLPGIIAADALLFPMDRIFENYVAAQLRRACASIGIIMQSQDHGKYLFDEPKRYHLRPDLVATNDNRTVILDTKWKLPINGKPAQGDMYQMLAYAIRYGADHVVLVYPTTIDSPSGKRQSHRIDISGRATWIHTYFYSLPEITAGNDEHYDGAQELAGFIYGLF